MASAASTLIPLIGLAVTVAMIAGVWKAFEKAGQPGWASIIPIYNLYVMIQIADEPDWWLVLFFVPVINFLVSIKVTMDIAEKFGKGIGYALGMVFLPFIFWPLLGWSDAEYRTGSAGASPQVG